MLQRAAPGTRVCLVTSHLSGPSALHTLLGLARRGLALEVLVGATERRVSARGERRLAAAGIPVRRVVHPQGLPMHDKFLLIEAPDQRQVVFGSFNWSEPSRRFNREIGADARITLWDAFRHAGRSWRRKRRREEARLCMEVAGDAERARR
jgi:hypothetical protein